MVGTTNFRRVGNGRVGQDWLVRNNNIVILMVLEIVFSVSYTEKNSSTLHQPYMSCCCVWLPHSSEKDIFDFHFIASHFGLVISKSIGCIFIYLLVFHKQWATGLEYIFRWIVYHYLRLRGGKIKDDTFPLCFISERHFPGNVCSCWLMISVCSER